MPFDLQPDMEFLSHLRDVSLTSRIAARPANAKRVRAAGDSLSATAFGPFFASDAGKC